MGALTLSVQETSEQLETADNQQDQGRHDDRHEERRAQHCTEQTGGGLNVP
jgi:hypothetical protein